MKDKTIQTKVKGTVLYTVISVLMILVVFLMGTLALAATASNRAYGNYQKKQTEATARAVLDSVVQAINEDSDLKGEVEALVDTGGELKVEVSGTDGLFEEAYITYYGERQVLNTHKQKEDDPDWIKGWMFEVRTVASRSMAETSYSAYIVEGTIVSDPGQGSGAFVALGDAGNQIGTHGTVAGGTEIGIGKNTLEDYTTGQNTYIQAPFYVYGSLYSPEHVTFNFTNLGDYIAIEGDYSYANALHFTFQDGLIESWEDLNDEIIRKNNGASDILDITKAKYQDVPCIYIGGTFNIHPNQSVTIGGTDAVPVNIYCGDIQIPGSFSHYGDLYAFDETATSKITNLGETKLYQWVSKVITGSNGNDSIQNYGSFYTAGSVSIENQSRQQNIEGDLRVAKDLTITSNSNVTVGHNVVCGGTLKVTAGSTLTINGDLYAYELDNAGTINCTGTIQVLTVTNPGNLTVTPVSTAGLSFTTVQKWHDNVVVTISSNNGNYPFSYQYSYEEYTKDNTGTTAQTITGNSGDCWYFDQNTYATYEEYLAANDAFFQELGVMQGTSGQAYAATVNVYDMAEVYGAPIYPQDYTKEEITKKIIDIPAATTYDYPDTLQELDDTFGILDSNGNLALPTYSGGTITNSCILTGGSTNNIYIKSSGSPIVVIIDNFTISNNASIIVDENLGDVYFYVRNEFNILGGGCVITTDYLNLFTRGGLTNPWTDAEITGASSTAFEKILSQLSGNMTIYEYTGSKNSEYFPNLYIYAEDGAKLYLGHGEGFMTANIRAPKLTFKQDATNGCLNKTIQLLAEGEKVITYDPNSSYVNKNGIDVVTRYIDDQGKYTTVQADAEKTEVWYATETLFEQGDKLNLIGQLICGEIDISNQWGMIYVTDTKKNGEGSNGAGIGGDGDYIVQYYNFY